MPIIKGYYLLYTGAKALTEIGFKGQQGRQKTVNNQNYPWKFLEKELFPVNST